MTDIAAPAPPAEPPLPQPPAWRERVVKRVLKVGLAAFALVVVWLIVTAPLSSSLQPAGAPGLTVLSAEGEPIARRGAIMAEPVDVTRLPPYVGQAFVAMEDRRFFRHVGIDPWGIARAMVRNLRAGRVREGGSTISQQLAKTSFLTPDRTWGRKAQEAVITLWLEARLSKEEILSRYLSNVYFGDNVYGLRAAARHYFNTTPEELTLSQAAMLAGVVNAPSRLAPTVNLEAARARARLVLAAMQEAGYISEAQRRAAAPARLRRGREDNVPTGTYFADWIVPQASELAEGSYGERQVVTTLDGDLQRLAARIVRRAGLGRAQAALVAMRLDGRVVAMVGGRDYAASPFNRATQARRQPGSAFKLFVYLAALRAGYRPDTIVNDTPIDLNGWRPRNYDGQYRGPITLRDAFAMSSNSVAVQLQERVGRDAVIRAARDLGVTTDLRPDPTLALGSNGVSLLELTAAYAAVAAGRYPIRPRGIPGEPPGWLDWSRPDDQLQRDPAFRMLRELLYGVVARGTGRAAALSIPTFGKTGTTSDYRDALFVGFAGDLVVGVWIGNDDNSPLPGTSGGGAPARIWRTFMTDALGLRAARAPARRVPLSQADRGAPETNAVETQETPAPQPVPPPQPTAPELVAPPPAPRQDEQPPRL
ncbi:transglycosylase domain-containing protein [Sphingosinicella sp.]|uniref:transglycosylase domain-containing protein n=1 Tax=Sphingosinicella sp. TaxID=1917971 RepID=UPI00403782B8